MEGNMKKANTNKVKIDKKELIITIVVLLLSIVIGFLFGKGLFEALYGQI